MATVQEKSPPFVKLSRLVELAHAAINMKFQEIEAAKRLEVDFYSTAATSLPHFPLLLSVILLRGQLSHLRNCLSAFHFMTARNKNAIVDIACVA